MKVTNTKELGLDRKPGLQKQEAYLSGTKKCEQFYKISQSLPGEKL